MPTPTLTMTLGSPYGDLRIITIQPRVDGYYNLTRQIFLANIKGPPVNFIISELDVYCLLKRPPLPIIDQEVTGNDLNHFNNLLSKFKEEEIFKEDK